MDGILRPILIIVLATAGGRVLNARKVEMVGIVEEPRWSPTRVSVKLLLDWELE